VLVDIGHAIRFVMPNDKMRFTIGGELIHHSSTIQRSSQELGGNYLFDDNGNPGRNDPFTSVAGYMLGDVQLHPRVKISAGARFDYFSTLKPGNAGEAFVPPFSPFAKSIVPSLRQQISRSFLISPRSTWFSLRQARLEISAPHPYTLRLVPTTKFFTVRVVIRPS
jgi:hypothetical protein